MDERAPAGEPPPPGGTGADADAQAPARVPIAEAIPAVRPFPIPVDADPAPESDSAADAGEPVVNAHSPAGDAAEAPAEITPAPTEAAVEIAGPLAQSMRAPPAAVADLVPDSPRPPPETNAGPPAIPTASSAHAPLITSDDPALVSSRETSGSALGYLGVALRWAAGVALAFAGALLLLIVLYRWVDPPTSSLMLAQRLAGIPIEQRWVPLNRISPNLVHAVVLSEDARFCRHRGVDWAALEEAIESARGGSTITMQVVKNLFLWPSRSYIRKAIEIALAYVVELVWPKQRILEIYLNIAEWGEGVFGVQAAARFHFDKSAARLTAQEAALLAVALPNPIEREAGAPGPGAQRLAANLLLRMKATRTASACAQVRRPGF